MFTIQMRACLFCCYVNDSNQNWCCGKCRSSCSRTLGKLDGLAVPTINVSLVDLTFTAKRATTKEEINSLMKEASEGALKGI